MDKLEAMLESFYGMQDEETAARDAHDIDSSAFSVSEVASEVLLTKTLPELLGYNRSLVQETRSLDENMQSLVYNNYNKFISATDTIRHMKDSVGEMESKMKGLVVDMSRMGGSSATVNESLQENRAKIEKLVGVKRLLLKLEFLFELPLRLKRSIELDAQAQAVKYYTTVSGVLNKYDHIPSIHKIRIEADAIINGLRNDLRAVLKDKSGGSIVSTSGKVVEAIRLLVQLGEPRPALRAAFLKFQKSRLSAQLAHFAASHNTAAGDIDATSTTPEPSPLLSSKAQSLFVSASAAQSVSGSAPFTSPRRVRATVSAYAFMQSLNRNFLDSFKVAAELYVELFEQTADGDVGEAERRVAHDDLLSFSKDLFSDYFGVVRRQLSLPPAANRSSLPLSVPARSADGNEGAGGVRSPAAEAGAKRNPFLAKAGKKRELNTGTEGDDDAELLAAAEKAKAQALAAAAALAASDGASEGQFGPVTDGLKLLLSDIRTARHVKEARLVDRAHEVTEAVLRAQLDGLFADVRVDVLHQLAVLRRTVSDLETSEKEKAVKEAKTDGPTNPFGVGDTGATARPSPRYDHLQTIGAGLAAAAEQASNAISARIDEALHEAKPLILSGMRLLPELARIFHSLVHGQLLNMLLWLASACEALGDRFHPSRTECAAIVVEADLGLERETRQYPSSAKGAAIRVHHARAGSSVPAAMKRRVAVHFGLADDETERSDWASHTETDSTFILFLASLCRHFSNNGVARALSTMLQSLPTRSDLQALGASFGDNEVDAYGSMADVPDLIKRTQAAGRELLRKFVYQHSTRLSAVVRRALTSTDWLTYPEPSDVRLMVNLVLEDVAQIRKLVACTLGDWDARGVVQAAQAYGVGSAHIGTSPPSPSNPFGPTNPFSAPPAPSTLRTGPSAGTHPSLLAAAQATRRTGVVVGAAGSSTSVGGQSLSGLGTSTGRGNMHLDIDRLFRSNDGGHAVKIVLGSVDYTSDSVVKVLLKCVFKALLEWTRSCRLGTYAYQQLQIDIGAFHLALPFFTSPPPPPSATATATSAVAGGFDPYAGAAALEEMLNEAAMVASERCLEPKPIESSIVFKLGSEKLANMQVAI